MELNKLKDFSNRYLEILQNDLGSINLTRILDSNEFFNKQILDSIFPFSMNPDLENVLRGTFGVLDVGFGGGFPILPLAFYYPDVNFFGIEARAKKVSSVELLAKKLGLKNVSLFHGRIEDFAINKDVLLTFKAVGKISKCLMDIQSSNKNIKLQALFYKGPSFEKETKEELAGLKHWLLEKTYNVDVPETEKRILVHMKQVDAKFGAKKSNLFHVEQSNS